MNINEELQKYIDLVNRFYMLVRTDAAVRGEVRVLAMGILCCFVVAWGGKTVLIEPKTKAINAKQAELAAQVESPPGTDLLLTGSAMKLEKEKKELEGKKEILNIQERVLREHWQELADPETFTQVILTLLPGAPVNIRENLGGMKVAATRTIDGFELHPVSLEGETYYYNLVNYLQYIERRQEIGMIDDLKIEGLPPQGDEKRGRVRFSMIVGRLMMKQS
ncbi:MAG: hypothetical protein KAK02_09400 [Desulfobulbaceae bacterium]|nr:hypothetical protein [Desulfobulbaceae bacterium]